MANCLHSCLFDMHLFIYHMLHQSRIQACTTRNTLALYIRPLAVTGHVEFFNKSLLQSLVIKLNKKPLNLIQLLD